MSKYFARAVAAALLLAWAADARADPLFSHGYDVQSGFAGTAGDLAVSLSVMTGVESPDWATVSFGHFTPADAGRTVTLTPASGGDFGRLTGRLTDGTRHVIFFEWSTPDGGGGLGAFEPAIIWGDVNDPRIDLAGYQVDSLSLRVDRLSFTQQGGRTDISGAFTLSAEGRAIPEPAAGLTALLPTGAGLLRRRRRSQP